MNGVRWCVWILALVPVSYASAEARNPIARDFVLAIHSGQDRAGYYGQDTMEKLGDYLYEQLRKRGGFRLVDRAQVKRRMNKCLRSDLKISKHNKARRLVAHCRLQAGQEAGAQKGISLAVEKGNGILCRLRIYMFDQLSGARNLSYGNISHGDICVCEFDSFLRVIDRAVHRMAREKSVPRARRVFVKTDAEREVELARLLERDERLGEALEHLRRAAELDPSWKRPLVTQAHLAERCEDFESLRNIYRQLIGMTKMDPSFRERVRRRLLKTQSRSQARRFVRGSAGAGGKGKLWLRARLPIDDYYPLVSAADDGSVFVTGRLEYEEDDDRCGSGLDNVSEDAKRQMILARFDANGTQDWLIHSRPVANPDGRESTKSFCKGTAIEALPSGEVLVAGIFYGSVDFGAGKRADARLSVGDDGSIFLARFRRNGSLRWIWRSINKEGVAVKDIVAIPNGGCMLAGTFYKEIQVSKYGPASRVLTARKGYEVFVARFDPDGKPKWATAVPQDGKWMLSNLTMPVAIDAHGDGSSVLIATLEQAPEVEGERRKRPDRQLHMFGFGPDGKRKWTRRFPEDLMEGRDVAALPKGAVLLTGSLFRPLCLRSGACLVPDGNSDAFVARLDRSGRFDWAYRMGGDRYDRGVKVAAMADGSFVWLGRLEGEATKGGVEAEDLLLQGPGPHGFLVQGFDARGRPCWMCLAGPKNSVVFNMDMDLSRTGWVAVSGNSPVHFSSWAMESNNCSFDGRAARGVFVMGIDPSGKRRGR